MPETTVKTNSEQWEWGVCGFVSVLSALQDQKMIDLGHYSYDSKEHRDLIISLVKDFLRQLQTEKPTVAKEIETFTQSFGGNFATQTLQGFLQHDHGCGPAKTNPIGIAMTPDGIVEFLLYVKRSAGRQDKPASGMKPPYLISPSKRTGPSILGLGKEKSTERWHGLKHWVYYKSDIEIYTWGDIYTWGGSDQKKDLKRQFDDVLFQVAL